MAHDDPEDDVTLPLAVEEAAVRKVERVTGRTRVHLETDEHVERLSTGLIKESVEVRRVTIGRMLDAGEEPPLPRTENGVMVFPVLEEVPVIVKRLRVVEELHIVVHQHTEETEVPVTVRKQSARVEHIEGDEGYSSIPPDSTQSGEQTMTLRTLTALFSNRSDALRAVDRLVEAGISRSSVRLLPETETTAGSGNYDTTRDDKGFWASLGDMLFPTEDRYSYAEALHRGDTAVTATVDETMLSTAEDILDDDGTVSIEDREEAWRTEGWKGWGDEQATSRSRTDAEGVIPLAEEELRVGKREVDRGRVRVRSYVVEEPVTADVNLREESVHVERRPVNETVSQRDADSLFRERTVEIEKRGEEAVVDKTARVREEVAVGKTVEERTETIRDKVRRTEVEVEGEDGTLDPERKSR